MCNIANTKKIQAAEPWAEQPRERVCSQPAVRGGAPGGQQQQQQRGGQGESQVLQQARAARSVTAVQSPLASVQTPSNIADTCGVQATRAWSP